MTNDSRYILLEYNQQHGLFHYNTIYNGRFNSEPNTYGWEPIALTLESKASLFCNIADAVIHRRREAKKEPFSVTTIKQGWKSFCFAYNYLATRSIPDNMKQEARELFCAEMAMARLGNRHLADLMTEDTPLAWDYDPMSYKDSNY